MLDELPPPSRRWLLTERALGILGTYSFAVLAAHWITGENPEAWPGDDWRVVGKIYVGVATTWLLWHRTCRSLDRGGST